MAALTSTASPPPPPTFSHTSPPQLSDNPAPQKRDIRTSINLMLQYLGPGFLVSIAYIDPGNFETDLQAGAQYKYELLWVILWATCAALFIQSLAANLGIVTGMALAEHCRTEYPRTIYFCLWIAAEVAVIANDVPEVLGTAFALNILFNIPVWVGVILTGLGTLGFLAMQQCGARKLEIFIALLVFAMATCFFVEVGYAKPAVHEVLKGIVVPRLAGDGATALAISFLGSIVVPLYIYTSMQQFLVNTYVDFQAQPLPSFSIGFEQENSCNQSGN